MRIYLIGFMGSGKSTLGQRVAEMMQVPFTDTDTLVTSAAGKDIQQIFDLYGESRFRELEKAALRETIQIEKSIIATGGGLPCFEDNMRWMKQHGITIYLQWSDEQLLAHLEEHKEDRPLLKGKSHAEKESWRTLLQSRKPIYELAAITLEMRGDIESDVLLLGKACRYIW